MLRNSSPSLPSSSAWSSPAQPRTAPPAPFVLGLAIVLAAAVPRAQQCPGQGSRWQPAAIEAGPELPCAQAPGWPAWHLVTPPYRRVVPMPGMQQGRARPVPRVLVRWRCTGFLLVPVVVAEVRTMGFELDVEFEPCQLARDPPH